MFQTANRPLCLGHNPPNYRSRAQDRVNLFGEVSGVCATKVAALHAFVVLDFARKHRARPTHRLQGVKSALLLRRPPPLETPHDSVERALCHERQPVFLLGRGAKSRNEKGKLKV